jgi:hypothetical protein
MLELIEDCQNGSSLNAPYYSKSDDVGKLPKEKHCECESTHRGQQSNDHDVCIGPDSAHYTHPRM